MTTRSSAYGPPAPVPIFQREWEFSEALNLYRERQPARVLEIGTYFGGTLYHWLANAAPGAVVVSVDTYAVSDPPYPDGWEGPRPGGRVDNRRLYPEWTPAGATLHALEADSHDPDTLRRVKAFAPYDWVFLDAGHRYPEVRADWETYRPLVRSGGLFLFHDILTSAAHPEIEVERLWREIQREGHTTRELVADPAALWGGIGVASIP